MNDTEQQLLAEQLRRYQAQAQTTAPQGRMVGRSFVRPHALEYIAAGLRGYGGMQGEQAVTKQLQDMATRRQESMAGALRGFAERMQDQPEQGVAATDSDPGYVIPGRRADPMAAYAQLMESGVPDLQRMGMQGMVQMPEIQARQRESDEARRFRAEQATEDRQFRLDQLAAQNKARQEQMEQAHQLRMDTLSAQNASREQLAQAQREFAAQQAQLQREFQLSMAAANRQHQASMAGLAASLRPERMVTVLGPNGEAVSLPQSQAQGMPLYNPQAAANLKREKTKEEAKNQLSSVVQQLNNSYDALEKGGGITSTSQNVFSNIAARAGSTGIGQAIGGALGTDNQRHRQEIAQTRPLLLNLIKEATGMSAQQMNSNIELQLYLQAATDPTLSIEANRSALANLDRLFGLGLAKRDKEPAAPKPGALSSEDAQAMEWARKNPNDPRAKEIMQRLGGRP